MPTSKKRSTKDSEPEQLVVAFHGTYLFTYWRKTVEILIPRVPEHMYLVEEGNEEMPTPRRFGLLDGGEFPLRGVIGSDVPVVPASNEAIVVHKQRQSFTKEKLFCRLFVPNPSRIVCAMVNRPVDENEAIFYGASAADIETRRFPACMLFFYDQLDSSGLSFGDLPWKPVADQNGVVHLRIYSEDIQCPANSGPDSAPLFNHMRNAFRMLMSLMPDMDVDIVPGSQYIGVPQVSVAPANAADLQGLPQRLQVDCGPEVRSDPPFNCAGVNNNQNP